MSNPLQVHPQGLQIQTAVHQETHRLSCSPSHNKNHLIKPRGKRNRSWIVLYTDYTGAR